MSSTTGTSTAPRSSMPDIVGAERRTRAYWVADGSAELAVGLVFALIGLMFVIEAGLQEGSSWQGLSAYGLPVITIGGYFLSKWLVNSIKERITYPRTGYVAYPEPSRRQQLMSGAVAAVVAFAVGYAIIIGADFEAWLPALQGLAIGVLMFLIGQRMSVTRFTVFAMLSVAIGVLAVWASVGPIAGSGWVFGGVGVVMMASGGYVLRRFLDSAPEPTSEIGGDDADDSFRDGEGRESSEGRKGGEA